MGGAITWVWRDGQRLTPAMLHDFLALDEDFYRRTGCRLKISSGIRTDQEQIDIFLARYVPVWEVRGRRVYDWAWWNGVQYGRISPAGKVAVPTTSNHQINLARNQRGALDLYDTGSDAGILTRGSFRANVFDEIAPRYGYDSEGYLFGENWHKRYNRDPFRPVPSPAPPAPKETKVKTFHRQDYRARNGGMVLEPGQHFYLHTDPGVPRSQAKDVVGGPGNYSITPHIYAEGEPGDVIEIVLLWDNLGSSGPHSAHYVERVTVDRDGQVRASREFKRAVAPNFAVYLKATAAAENKGSVKVTVLDSDAYLFVTA